jgi:cytoplasmic iron level regulating protein YaaA (DUF328/UPF0246 family)
VLILLPPSETKAQPRRGKPVELATLSFPELTGIRERVLDALVATSAASDALLRLGVPDGAADQVAANVGIRSASTLPASRLYTGVLFEALELADLDAASRRRAGTRLVVASALWGFSRITDRLPAYRLSAGARLVGIGPVASAWRSALGSVMPSAAGAGVIVESPSRGYAAMWRPAGALAERTLPVVIEREVGGRRTVVSHLAKFGRGLLARTLVLEPGRPRSADEVVDVARAGLGPEWGVELGPVDSGRGRILTLVDQTELGAFAEHARRRGPQPSATSSR